MFGKSYIPLGYVTFQVGGTVVAMPTLPAGTNRILISAFTANVCWTDDGSIPTGTRGILVPTGQGPFEYTGNPTALQFRSAGAASTVGVACYQDSG